MLDDFKKFLLRGNVVDMAVGVVIGGAFGAIVKSLVDDVIMPPIGMLTGGADFSNLYVVLREGAKAPAPYATLAAAKDAGAVLLRYGAFLNTLMTFLIVGTAIYFVVRAVTKLMPPPPPPPEESRDCPHCTMSISKKATRCPHCTSEIAAAG